jgi:hypothetical protein
MMKRILYTISSKNHDILRNNSMLKTRSLSSLSSLSTPKMDRFIDTTTSEFEKIRNRKNIYVDKTEILSSLVRSDSDNFILLLDLVDLEIL